MPLTEEFQQRLTELAAGAISASELEQLLTLLGQNTGKYHFHRGCENNFIRIIESGFNRALLIRDILQFPLHLEVLLQISANSNYLTDILVRNPGLAYRLFEPSHLESLLEKGFYRGLILNSLVNLKSFESRVNSIKSAKRREILSTGVKDIMGYLDLKRATAEMSVIATVLSEALFVAAFEKTLHKYGIRQFNFGHLAGITPPPENESELLQKLSSFAVISLGKLGGGELNYSSDIDLIVVFEENFTLQNGREYFELLNDTIILFTESAVTITEAGYLFRVDFRLRPDGHAAPLARTLRDTVLYYETRGANWERQMLIKAGFLCGDRSLFTRFINSVTPFVYPVSFFKSPTEQVATLRNEMLRTIGDANNIKLFKGGIRDIEFAVQALQLLNAGRNIKLRTGNTLTAIERLDEAGIISNEEASILREAYQFYRKIEHYLQLMNDRQTHVIPSDGDILKSMTVYLGFAINEEFDKKLADYRKQVRKIYESVVGSDAGTETNEQDISFFKDQGRARKNLQFLKEGKGLVEIKEFDSRTTSLWMEIEERFLEDISKTRSPDTILTNLAKIISRTAFPSYWYEAMKDNFVLWAIMTLCEYSEYSVRLLLEDHSLKDIVFSGKLFEEIDPHDDQYLSTKALLFLVSSQFMLGFIDEVKASASLSATLRNKVKRLISEQPPSDGAYFVAVAGSFSIGEMHLYSDADLIVVVDDMKQHPDVEFRFIALLAAIREEMSPLGVDCRLRPEGKSAQLVWDIRAYEQYFEKRVAAWELQSLTKISFIYGDENLFQSFLGLLSRKVASLNHENLRKDIFEMRKRLYPVTLSGLASLTDFIKGRGGTTDIEFITQYLVLLDSENIKFLTGKSNRENLSLNDSEMDNKWLKVEKFKAELLVTEEVHVLLDGFNFLRRMRLAIECIYNTSNCVLPSKQKGELLYRFLQFASYEEMVSAVNSTLKKNNEIFQQIFKG